MAKEDYLLGPGKGAFENLPEVHVNLGASYQQPEVELKGEVVVVQQKGKQSKHQQPKMQTLSAGLSSYDL